MLTIACRHLHLASDKKQHTVKVRLQHLRHKRPTFAFMRESGYTLGASIKIAHNGLHAETRAVSDGEVVSLPSDCFTRFGNPVGPGVRMAYFAAFRPWSGVLPENAESLRNSDVLMRVAVPRRRGPAGLRDLFSFLSKLRFSHSVLRAFRVRKRGWYHYPRSVPRTAETLDGRLSKRFIFRFLRPGSLH